MENRNTGSSTARKLILAALLVSVVSSGIPLGEVHSHENATIGHTHGVHGHDDAGVADGDGQGGLVHAHVVDVATFTLSQLPRVEVDSIWHADVQTIPHFRPPDNVIAPLYRPPIA